MCAVEAAVADGRMELLAKKSERPSSYAVFLGACQRDGRTAIFPFTHFPPSRKAEAAEPGGSLTSASARL